MFIFDVVGAGQKKLLVLYHLLRCRNWLPWTCITWQTGPTASVSVCAKCTIFPLSLFSLDLDQWINEPPSDSSDEERDRTNVFVSVDEQNRYSCCVGLLLAACQLFLLVLNLHVLQTLVSYGYKRAKQIEFSLAWLLVVAQLLYVPRDQLCPWLLSCVWYEHLDEGICIFVKLCDVRFVVCSVLWCDVCNDLCAYIMCNDDVLWCDV